MPNVARPIQRLGSAILKDGSVSPRRASSGTFGSLTPPPGSTRSLHHHLCSVPHLSTVPFDELAKLDIMVREFAAMDSVLEAGSQVQHVYVIIAGAIEVFMDAVSFLGQKRVGRLTAPNVFGMDNVLLDRKCKFTMRAGCHTTVLLLQRDDFYHLIRTQPVFARSVAEKIADQLSVFGNFQTLCRSIFSVSSSVVESKFGEAYQLNLAAILQSYSIIGNVMHKGQKDTSVIDVMGWKYAIHRLPQNIVETYVLTLLKSLPPFIRKELQFIKAQGDGLSPGNNESIAPRMAGASDTKTWRDNSFSMADPGRPSPLLVVPTSDRRRKAYQVSKGHTLVLLREGFTDVLDLVTCLCIHLIEAKKVRIRMQSMVKPTALDILQDGMVQWSRALPNEQPQVTREVLSGLNFTKAEIDGFCEMWPNSALHRLNTLLMAREEVVVRLDNSLARRFDIDPYLAWALSLRRRVLAASNLAEGDSIPGDAVFDILCCNTHTPKNLLCSFSRQHRDKIMQWGRENKPGPMELPWSNRDDLLYYLASSAASHNAYWGNLYRDALAEGGFSVIDDSDSGLQVDIIDMSKINPDLVDPIIAEAYKKRKNKASRNHFILNVDFAFGAQADGILRALILTFGKRIRSVNVVSKCGGLHGNRGDIVLPSQLIFSKQVLGDDTPDEFRYAGNPDLTKKRIQELAPDRVVHTGPIVTIPGLVLQNEKVLKYYQRMWSCDGLEMEGSYYARQVEESVGLDLLRSDIITRFGYHIVDLPLGGQNLGRGSKPTAMEAVPPMYTLVRAIMEQILKE